MKTTLFFALCLALVGCGTTTDEIVLPQGDVTKVTAEMRTACASVFKSDEAIASMIAAVEIDRANGLTKDEELASGNQLCTDANAGQQCPACMQVIIDYVYGK